jgi:hypothetical protein
VQFVDTEFPPNEATINGDQDIGPITDRMVHWRRPHEIIIDEENEEIVIIAE